MGGGETNPKSPQSFDSSAAMKSFAAQVEKGISLKATTLISSLPNMQKLDYPRLDFFMLRVQYDYARQPPANGDQHTRLPLLGYILPPFHLTNLDTHLVPQ